MATAEGAKLFSQSFFNPPADSPALVAACPTIDLSAAVGEGNVVYIRRRGGDIVSKVSERNKEVQAVTWKADGKCLAIAWSDGVVRLVGLESSKAANQIRLFEKDPAAISFISWSKNLAGRPESWQGQLPDSIGGSQSKEIADLPRDLMFLEVEEDLPKLLPLPVSGGSGDDIFVFSTRTSLEFMFPALRPSDGDSIHVMVLGTADGVIHVSIYDTFVMGSFRVGLPMDPARLAGGSQPLLQLRRHASHPASSTHALLFSNEEHDRHGVYLAPMDFSFIYSSPLNLSLVAFKTNTFQKLARYIKQTQVHMQGEWQSARELPGRFLANIQEDLEQEPRYKSIDHALRVAALMGYVSPTMKQWLVDTIAERGHKRWDKAVVSGLGNLRDLIHDNMMPALDRAMLTLSRLHGLADFHSQDKIGFTADEIAQLMDKVACLILASHNALRLVTAELELFVAFSAWFRQLIERLALPAQAEEQADKEPVLSVTPVLDYISNHLLESPLDVHFGKTSEADWEADWHTVVEQGEGDKELLGKLETELRKVDDFGVETDLLAMLEGGPLNPRAQTGGPKRAAAASAAKKGKQPVYSQEAEEDTEEDDGTDNDEEDEDSNKKDEPCMKAFPKFAFLTKLFSMHADRVLKDIAESGKQHVRFGPLTRLDVGAPVQKADVAMTALLKEDKEDSADVLAYTVLIAAEQPRNVYLFRTAVKTSAGISTAVSTQACAFAIDGDGSVADIQFLGTDLVLVLWTWSNTNRPPRLLAIPPRSPRIGYADYDSSGGRPQPTISIGSLRPEPSQGSTGLTSDGLCWIADLEPPSPASNGGAAVASPPVVRMQVLPPTGGPAVSPATPTASSTRTETRVCLMYADRTTYRVFVLPPVAAMFGDE